MQLISNIFKKKVVVYIVNNETKAISTYGPYLPISGVYEGLLRLIYYKNHYNAVSDAVEGSDEGSDELMVDEVESDGDSEVESHSKFHGPMNKFQRKLNEKKNRVIKIVDQMKSNMNYFIAKPITPRCPRYVPIYLKYENDLRIYEEEEREEVYGGKLFFCIFFLKIFNVFFYV